MRRGLHNTCRISTWGRCIVGNNTSRHEVIQSSLIRALFWKLQDLALSGKYLLSLKLSACHIAKDFRHSLEQNKLLWHGVHSS